MSLDIKKIFAEVQEASRRWEACPRHFWPRRSDGYRLGEKLRCAHCGVERRLSDVGLYVKGYIAAGGNAEDVMPDWNKKSASEEPQS